MMPFDSKAINANLEAARGAQRMLDDARVGFRAFESARTALDEVRTGGTHLTDLGAANTRIKDFDAARGGIAGVMNATVGLKKARFGLANASFARSLASIAVPKPAFDVSIKPPQSALTNSLVPSAGVYAQAADMYRLKTAGMLSQLFKADSSPILGTVQRLAEFNAAPKLTQPLIPPGWITAATSALAGRGVMEAFHNSGASDALRTFQSVSAVLFRLSQSLTPYVEPMARLMRQLAEYAAFQPSWPDWGTLGVKALEALDSGRHWIADAFLRGCLRLYPTPGRREALWKILKKGFEAPFDSLPPWLTLNQGRATAYLRVAVYREAKRIQRDRKMNDRLWWKKSQEAPLSLDPELSGLPEFEDPFAIVAREMEQGDDRVQILNLLLTDGTQRDKEIARLVLGGEHTRAEIRNMVGSSNLQSFERKAQRMREKGIFLSVGG